MFLKSKTRIFAADLVQFVHGQVRQDASHRLRKKRNQPVPRPQPDPQLPRLDVESPGKNHVRRGSYLLGDRSPH
jgi:hypothetical protein